MLFFVVCVLPGCLFWHLYSVRIVIVFVNSQKQLSEVFYKKSSYKFCKIYRKTPLLESLFHNVAGLRPATSLKKRLQHNCFHKNFPKFLRTLFYRTRRGDCFLILLSL